MKDHIDKSQGHEIIAVDGAYANTELIEKGKEKDITMIPTDLAGKEGKDIYADFIMSEDGTKVIKCANGITPKRNTYNQNNGQVVAAFDTEICKTCPFQSICHPKMNKKTSRVTISLKSVIRAKMRRMIKTDEYKEKMKYRNGVEAILSIMRRKYIVDKMPVRGKTAMKLQLGFKIMAHNFKKMVRYLRDNYVQKVEMVMC